MPNHHDNQVSQQGSGLFTTPAQHHKETNKGFVLHSNSYSNRGCVRNFVQYTKITSDWRNSQRVEEKEDFVQETNGQNPTLSEEIRLDANTLQTDTKYIATG